MQLLKKLGLPVLFLASICAVNAKTIIVHTIGDSTMANYDENATDKRGWGMMFQQFFNDSVTVNNRGKSGASSKSFYLESAYWQTVKKQINKGDYVLIQFSHNDEKTNGTDGDSLKAYYINKGESTTADAIDYRGTTASDTYKEYLRKYINETRALGATPILVGPMCRKYFSSGKITRAGRHDLGDKFSILKNGELLTAQSVSASDHTYDYPYQMQQVAIEMNVPFIDLTSLTKNAFESYGNEACTNLLFCTDDSTHPNAMGGTLVARLCAKALAEKGILTDYINTSADLTVYPTTADLGSAYTGQTLYKEFSISGFDLKPTEGTIIVTAPDGFSLAKDKNGIYKDTIEYMYTGSNVNYSKFYVKCDLNTVGNINGKLTVSNGTVTKQANISATAIQLEGGQDVNAYWRLENDAECTLKGPATIIDESWSGMYVQKYSNPNANTTWPDGTGFDATRKTQRNLIVGDTWPAGEIDEVSTRYIQFGLQANMGTVLNIDSIGLYVCGCGGNGMRCRVSYSTNKDFSNPVAIAEYQTMTANNMMAVEATPVIKLSEGQTIYLRLYPWYNSSATGKTICLSDITIHGIAQNAKTTTSIATSLTTDTKIKQSIYSIDGRRLSNKQKGINLIVKTDTNGNKTVKKIIY